MRKHSDSNKVEALYIQICHNWLHNESVDYKKLEVMVDTLISEKPYFHDPDIYSCKLTCIENNYKKNSISKTKKIKECLNGFLASYWVNRDNIDMDKLCSTGIMAEGVDLYVEDKDKWHYIGFIKDMINYTIEKKLYRTSGDVSGFWFRRLAEACRYYEKNDSILMKRAILLADIYTALENLECADFDDALSGFEQVLSDDPDNALANYGMGRVFFESEEHKDEYKALDFLGRAAGLDVGEWRNYYLLAKMYIRKSDYVKAKENYLKAVDIFDEDGLCDLFVELKSDLGKHADDVLLKNILLKKEQSLDDRASFKSDYIVKNNFIGLETKVASDINKEADNQILTCFGEYFNDLEERSREALKYAEKAYLLISEFPESVRSVLCSNYKYYIAVLENEILAKVFKGFKSTFCRASDSFIKLKDLNNADRKSYFYKFLSSNSMYKSEAQLTAGQILGILNKDDYRNFKLKNNETYINFLEYIKYGCPILLEVDFKKQLSELNSAHTSIKHENSLRQLSVHDDFIFFRNIVMGCKKKRGLLYNFLKSYHENLK